MSHLTFSASFRRSNYYSPSVLILKMHRFLWRIRICMQSMKKTVDPHHHHFPSSSGPPIGRVQNPFFKISVPFMFSASR